MKTEENKEIETLKRTLTEMKMKLKSSTLQLENRKESLTGRNQTEYRTLGLKYKGGGLDKTNK